MTSDRPYRKALDIKAAREEIQRCSNSQFDPGVAAAFLSIGDSTWSEVRERVHRRVRVLKEEVERVECQTAV